MKKDFLKIVSILTLTLFIISCEKEIMTDQSYDTTVIENRESTTQYNLNGIDKEFYNYFITQQNFIDFDDTLASITPFYFDIDWYNVDQLNLYDSNTKIYELNDNPLEGMEDLRIKVLFKKNEDSTISAKILTYVADSIFYTDNNIEPNDTNYTGIIIESYDFESECKLYNVQLGSVIATDTYNPQETLMLRSDIIHCPDWEREHSWKRWWKRLKNKVRDLVDEVKSWFK